MGLAQYLASRFGSSPPPPLRSLPPVKLDPLPAPTWREQPEAVIARACAHPNRFPLWQAYRPLARVTIRRYELGVGRLPDCACPHERLVYPVRQAGRVVGLYGRRIACRCQTAKTLMARGSVKTLFGVDDLVPFWPLVIVENPVDAALLNQECNTAEYGVQAVAVGSAGIWRDWWTQHLRRLGLPGLLVWFDNDLAGYCEGDTFRRLAAAWRAANPKVRTLPTMHGPRLVGRLRRAGLPAYLFRQRHLFRSDRRLPDRADPGQFLIQYAREMGRIGATSGY